jgi:hypothetical protein
MNKMSHIGRQLVVNDQIFTTGFFLLLLLRGTQSALTVTPSNQVGVEGAQVALPCTIVTSGSFAWNFYSLAGQTCELFHSASGMGNCTDRSRYSVTPQTSGRYNLNINNTIMSDAGTYVCTDFNSSVAASAVYGVIGSEPQVTLITSQSCLSEGNQVVLTCRATYNGSNAMPPSMTWTTSTGQRIYSSMSQDAAIGLFQSTVYIKANTPNIPVHRCNVTFRSPNSDTVPPVVTPHPIQAQNAPTYSSVATSSSYTVQYCPRTLKVTLSNGDIFHEGPVAAETEVFCKVQGGSSDVTTIYTWINPIYGDILSRSQSVRVPVVDYIITCTAQSTVSCGVEGTTACENLNKTIKGAAYQSYADLPCHKRVECILPVIVCSISVLLGGCAGVAWWRH